ncbi:hypothetical protein FOMA001_g7751 [Fusarium oxysporum f. sp. matthiolae]|nr:hypothetical protein FOMA001_g7751 [Fusarium oxysporum f. sp. matthiolae]
MKTREKVSYFQLSFSDLQSHTEIVPEPQDCFPSVWPPFPCPEIDHDTATKGREELPPDGPGGSTFDSLAFNDTGQVLLSFFSLCFLVLRRRVQRAGPGDA